MEKNISESQNSRLLKLKTANEMVPTFISGVFLSGAINILTNDDFLSDVSDIISMIVMSFSCFLFFVLAAKIHGLRTWYDALPNENKTDNSFLNDTEEWDWGERRDFFKRVMLWLNPVAWVTGITGLFIYLFVDRIWALLYWAGSHVADLLQKLL